jgi:PKHD-type hydroxylase
MFVSILQNILDHERLENIHNLLESAPFVDGRISGGSRQAKKNLELNPEADSYLEVLQIVEKAVRENHLFNFTAFPRYMTRPIFSRYEAGMSYKEHVDFPVQGFISTAGKFAHRGLSPLGANYVRSDLSMTLFLSSPESYDGGELCFDAATGPFRAKLTAGSAVLYPTGVRHSVSEITRGVRLAAIFWIQTMFPVENHRRLICDSHRLMTILADRPDSPEHTLAVECFYNLFRTLAAV